MQTVMSRQSLAGAQTCGARQVSMLRPSFALPQSHFRAGPAGRSSFRVAAEVAEGGAETASVDGEAAELSLPPPGPIPLVKDNETFQDIFAFGGVLPERINGRLAMWGFATGVAAELSSHESIVEQAASNPVGIVLFMLLLSIGSIMPKFASGVSIGELLDAASRGSLPDALAFFNKTHELWVGRVAMLGFLGLIIVEQTVKGGAAFF